MYLIAGLGNPGREYQMTRHNIGFHAIDRLADLYGIKVNKLKYKSLWGECAIGGEKAIIVKPQTYMNLSGEAISEFARFYKIEPDNIIIIHDDVSLAPGRMRIRPKGSAGGHNGLKSIIYCLSSDEFVRIKIGVGAPEHKEYDLADYVLGHFTKDEIPVLEEVIDRSIKAAETVIRSGVQTAMNKFNN